MNHSCDNLHPFSWNHCNDLDINITPQFNSYIPMVLVNINHSYDSTRDCHSSAEITVIALVKQSLWFHDSSLADRIRAMVFVNVNYSYDSRRDLHTPHKVMRMIKSSVKIITTMIWAQSKSYDKELWFIVDNNIDHHMNHHSIDRF